MVKLISETISGGSGSKKQYKLKLQSFLDILVATPGRLLKQLDDGIHYYLPLSLSYLYFSERLSLRDVGYVVLDEGDSLLAKGQGFDEDMAKLLKVFSVRP